MPFGYINNQTQEIILIQDLDHIITKSIEGNESAQRSLYEGYRVKWFMTAMRYGKSKEQSEDIFQEGLIQIFKDLHQYNSKKSQFGTWSNRVIVHAALRYLKKYAWQNSIKDQDESLLIEDDQETIFQKISAKEITQLIQKLPIGYRLVFNMYVIEGYKHNEIATLLGIKEGTSKSQLAKARKTLKKQIELQLIHKHV